MTGQTGIGNLEYLGSLLPASGSADIVWAIVWIVIAFAAIYSAMLIYHWVRWGFSSMVVWSVMIVYGVGTVSLFSALVASARALT